MQRKQSWPATMRSYNIDVQKTERDLNNDQLAIMKAEYADMALISCASNTLSRKCIPSGKNRMIEAI
jgi:hypothetical protein